MSIEQDIRAEIENIKKLKLEVGYINNKLSILEGLCRKDKDDAYKKGFEDGKAVNEHYGELQDEAYQRGINDGSLDVKQRVEGAYQRGLEDAWEAARKIMNMSDPPYWDVFGEYKNELFKKFSVSEAIAKLKAYDDEHSDRIEVGDEVIYNGTTKCLVITPETDARYASLLDCNGIHYSADHRECKKTGKHYDIASILEAMRK